MSAKAPPATDSVLDRLLGLGISGAIRLAEGIGVEATLRLGEAFGLAWWALRGPRRNRVLAQLRRAFPEHEDAWVRARAREVFLHLGLGVAEGLLLAGRHRRVLLDRVDAVGLEHLEAARRGAEGRGVLVAAPHLGSWELAAGRLADLGLPVAAVYREPGRPAFDRALQRIRGDEVETIPMGERAGFRFIRALEADRNVLALLDQRGRPEESVLVTFFGRSASTRVAPLKLAARRGAPVVCGWARREPDRRRHTLTFEPALQPAGADSDDEEVLRRQAQVVTAALEKAIRVTPGQWIWTHRRWRDSPNDGAG